MKLVLDMNMPEAWLEPLRSAGFEASHWSSLGPVKATDETILEHASQHGKVIITRDLDFGKLLSAGALARPSVVQI